MEHVPADEAAAPVACTTEPPAEHYRRTRLQHHRHTDPPLLQQQQGPQQEQEQRNLHGQREAREKKEQAEKPDNSLRPELWSPLERSPKGTAAEPSGAGSAVVRSPRELASPSARSTAISAAADTAQQGEVQKLKQLEQPEREHPVRQQRLSMTKKEEERTAELWPVEEATQQLSVDQEGGLLLRNSLSPQGRAWQNCSQPEHSSRKEEGHVVVLQQYMPLEDSQQQLAGGQQSEISGCAGFRHQQHSPALHASLVTESQRPRQPAHCTEPSIDRAQVQSRQDYQQRKRQRHSGAKEGGDPRFDPNQYDDESLEDVLAAVAAAENAAEAPADPDLVGCSEQFAAVCRGDSQLPQGEPARQDLLGEELDQGGQWLQRCKISADHLQQERQNPDWQQQTTQRKDLAEPQNMSLHVLHARRTLHQTCNQQRAGHRGKPERQYEARAAGNDHICQEQRNNCQDQRSAETEQRGSQQPLGEQLNEAEVQSLQEHSRGRTTLHSHFHKRANQKKTSVCGTARLQRQQPQIIGRHEQEEEVDAAQHGQRGMRQTSRVRRHPLRDCDSSSAAVAVLRPQGRESELELDDEVCDFLEADLPPAAVSRWSDYLRLREQQQQQRQRQEQQPWQHPQQQKYRRVQEWPHVRQQRQAASGELSFCQTVAASPGADFHSSATLGFDEKSRMEAVQPPTNCVSCYAEMLTSPQGTPRRAADCEDRGPCTSPSLYSTSRTPRVSVSPRSRVSASLASATAFDRVNCCQLSGDATSRPSRVAKECTNSRIGERSTTGSGSTEISSSPARRNEQVEDRSGSCSSNSAQTTIKSPSGSCGTSRTGSGPDVLPFNCPSFQNAPEDLHALDGRGRPTRTIHPACSSDAQRGASPATPVVAPASEVSGEPSSSAGVPLKRCTNIPASPALPACASLRSSPLLTAPNVSSVRSPELLGTASALSDAPAQQLAAHRQSETLPSSSESAAATFTDPHTSLACTSAATPAIQRVLTASAARRAAEHTLDSAVRRPVSLENFFQLRNSRSGSTPSRRSLALSTANRAAADPPHSASEGGRSDTHVLFHSARRSGGTTEIASANSPSAANRVITSTLPSVLSPSDAMHRAVASDIISDTRTRPAASGLEVAHTSETVLHDNTLAIRPHCRALHALSEVRGTSFIDERAAEILTTSEDVDAGDDAADDSTQTRIDGPVANHEEHVNDSVYPAARRPSTQTKEGAKPRCGSATADAAASRNARRFIYLNSHEECTVCFIEIRVKGEVAMVEDCRHCFCCACLARWIKKSRTCPLCRRPVTTVELWRHARAALNKNSLAYGFLRRLRPDKNNVLKPITLPRRRPDGQRGRGNNVVKGASSGRAEQQI